MNTETKYQVDFFYTDKATNLLLRVSTRGELPVLTEAEATKECKSFGLQGRLYLGTRLMMVIDRTGKKL